MIHKQATRLTLFLIALSFLPRVSRSDGLIFQLPAEGVWARFQEQTKAEGTLTSKVLDPRKVEHEYTRTLTVKSLDRIQRHDQLCRWIEFSSESASGDVPMQPERVLKLLVPEEYLKRGEDPLSHAIKTFFSPSPIDRSAGHTRSNIDGGFNRVQYEIDRIRPVFPMPLSHVVSEGRETLELHGRKWENCEILTGTSHYDGPLNADGRMVFDSKCRVALHSDAPFGIVAMEIALDGIEYARTVTASVKSTHKITLVEVGQGAKSSLEPMKPREINEEASPTPTPADGSPGKTTKAQSRDSLPQIRELDRICQAKDGDAFREFVLLGSPIGKPAIEFYASQVDAGRFSVVDIRSAVVDGPLVHVSCNVSLAGRRLVIPFVFVKRGDKWRWLVVLGADRLEDAKAVLSDAEWKAWADKSGDAKSK